MHVFIPESSRLFIFLEERAYNKQISIIPSRIIHYLISDVFVPLNSASPIFLIVKFISVSIFHIKCNCLFLMTALDGENLTQSKPVRIMLLL